MHDLQQIQAYLAAHFPHAMQKFELHSIQDDYTVLKRHIDPHDLRPGATVSGPTLMQIADFAVYVGILAHEGLIEAAFTTNLNINFLRRPQAGQAIIAHTKILKAGKTLATGEVSMYSEGNPDLVAHAVATFALLRADDVSSETHSG